MNRVLFVIAFTAFAAALFGRATDPMVPQIAADLGVDVHSVTLLGTAFALPWAFLQPVLGPLGDFVGKGRVMTVCLVILIASAAIGATANSFTVLLISRIIGGAAAGGVNPVGMALVADLVPVNERQVAWGRVLTANISGLLLGGAIAGVLADLIGWRSVFVVIGGLILLATIVAAPTLSRASGGRDVSPSAVFSAYAQVLSNPRTKVCYGAVFVEGATLFGLFPFVAVFLVAAGEPRASIAGLVISAFAVGGVIYTLTVRSLIGRLRQTQLMIGGGLIAALGLTAQAFLPAWPLQCVALVVVGFGFYLMHSCIMIEMSELAPEARGTAVAGHAFSFYVGNALGPVLFGLSVTMIGPSFTILTSALIMALVGILTVRLLPPAAA
jgi:predicted MFS family arabinose efflux permease